MGSDWMEHEMKMEMEMESFSRVGRNVCHGSDSTESAEHEIKLWFPE